MSVDTDLSNLSITDLPPSLIAQILANAKKAEVEAAAVRRAQRARGRDFCATLVGFLADESTQLPEGPVGDKGAIGWTLGGKDILVTLPDKSTRMARVSVQVRWEDTIPASDVA